MAYGIKLIAICFLCLTFFGCAGKKGKQPDSSVVKYEQFLKNYNVALAPELDEETAEGEDSTQVVNWSKQAVATKKQRWNEEELFADLPRNTSAATHTVLSRAKTALGTPYRFGGERPGGFDCSGLVRWAFSGAGIKLPRTAAEQSTIGYGIRKSNLRAGDIVAFRRGRRGYHTGIYLGDGKFIHAPRTNSRVRIESMETGYFARNFIGARRIDMNNSDPQVAAAAKAQDKKSLKAAKKKGRTYQVASATRKTSAKVTKAKAAKVKKSSAKEKKTSAKVKKSAKSKTKKVAVAKKSKSKKTTVAKATRTNSKKKVATAKTKKKNIEVRVAKRKVSKADSKTHKRNTARAERETKKKSNG